jgi:hypothetical protein
MSSLLARLTPAINGDFTGSVHSAFQHVVNLSFSIGGQQRLLTLVLPDAPKLPDSVCVPSDLLGELQFGDSAVLRRDALLLRGRRYTLRNDTQWTGRARRRIGMPNASAFLRESEGISCGLDKLSASLRQKADAALREGNLQTCLGLGCGLTPAFDDACVGVMAVCAASGRNTPRITDLSITTDISARYLRLAAEGYFSQTVLEVLDALYGEKPVAAAIEGLLCVGATSGADTLYGMRIQLAQL